MRGLILASLFTLSWNVEAAIYKCETNRGTVYSEMPCPKRSASKKLEYSVNIQPAVKVGKEGKEGDKESALSNADKVLSDGKKRLLGANNCDYRAQEVETVKRAMKEWYPASMSQMWHDRLRAAVKSYNDCSHQQFSESFFTETQKEQPQQ